MNVRNYILIASTLLMSTIAHAAPSAFAFGPHGSWIIINEKRSHWSYQGERVPADVAATIKDMSRTEMVLGVGMNDTSWIVVGSRHMRRYNLPASLDQYIDQQLSKGYQIIDVALTANGNWVVMSRRNGYHAWWSSGGDVPQDLCDYLKWVTSRNHRVLGVGISPDGGWSAAYQCGGRVIYRMRRVPSAAIQHTDGF